jgi:hypothetical protein
MDRVHCSKCGKEHDLSDVELSCDKPAAYFEIPEDERARRVDISEAATVIDDGTPHTRFFLRGVIVIPVRGEVDPDGFGWGVWVEVAETDFERVMETWNDVTGVSEAPVSGRLANELRPFPGSLGLVVRMRQQAPDIAPEIDILARDHALGAKQRDGALPEDILDWLSPLLH